MGYKDPEKQREFQRNWARARRAKVSTNARAVELEWRMESVSDIKALVEIIVNELLCAEDLDLGIRARLILKGAEVAKTILEVGSFEERLTRLEQKILGVKV